MENNPGKKLFSQAVRLNVVLKFNKDPKYSGVVQHHMLRTAHYKFLRIIEG